MKLFFGHFKFLFDIPNPLGYMKSSYLSLKISMDLIHSVKSSPASAFTECTARIVTSTQSSFRDVDMLGKGWIYEIPGYPKFV